MKDSSLKNQYFQKFHNQDTFDIQKQNYIMGKLFIGLLIILVIGVAEIQAQSNNSRGDFSVKRMACFMLSRYYYHTQKQAVQSIAIELNPEQREKFQNKRLAVAVEYCMKSIPYDQAKKFILQEGNIKAPNLSYVFDRFDYTEILQDLETMSPNQEALLRFIRSYQDEVQIEREEAQAKMRLSKENLKPKMKIFGMSSDELPTSANLVYLGMCMGIIIGLVLYFRKNTMKQSELPPKKKRKQSPKKGK